MYRFGMNFPDTSDRESDVNSSCNGLYIVFPSQFVDRTELHVLYSCTNVLIELLF